MIYNKWSQNRFHTSTFFPLKGTANN